VSSFADFQRLIAQTTGADATVELLLLQMEPAAAKHFRLCAIPHQFDLSVFKLLMPEVEPVQAERRYQEFSCLSPVVNLTDALTLHDQARRFLFDQWLKENSSEFKMVSERLVKHFEKSGAVQNSYDYAYARRQRMFHMVGHDQSTGIEEFEKIFRDERIKGRLGECEALLALIREYDFILTQAHTSIVLYHEARLWFERRDWSHAEKLFRAVVAIDSLPQSYRIKSWNRIGLLFAKQRCWKDAILNLERAVRLAKESNDVQMLPFALHDLGTAYRDSGELDRSRRLLQESIHLAEKMQNTSCIAAAYNSLGTLERRGGDIRRGIEHYKTSLEYLRPLHDHLRTAQVYNNLGAAYADLGEWETSKEMYKKSLDLKTEAGDTIGLARTLSNLIPVYQHLFRLPDAIAAAEKATSIFETLRDPFSAAVATRNLAKIRRGTGTTAEIRANYLRAIELFRDAKDYDQAEATNKELYSYSRPVGMPGWYWTAIVFLLLVVVGFVAWHLLTAE
jgi:tetratricopeptide (TPR) repeat protein